LPITSAREDATNRQERLVKFSRISCEQMRKNSWAMSAVLCSKSMQKSLENQSIR